MVRRAAASPTPMRESLLAVHSSTPDSAPVVRMASGSEAETTDEGPGFSDSPAIGEPPGSSDEVENIPSPDRDPETGPGRVPRLARDDDLGRSAMPRRDRSGDAGGSVGPDLDQPDTDLDRPRAQQRGGGGGPTRSRAEEEATDEEDDFKSDLLARLLGIQESRIGAFGWLQGSFTGNPASPRDGVNFGVNPNSFANRFVFQQLYFVVERRVRQGDEIDFGFRSDSLYGADWQQFHMTGLFDRAFVPGGFGYEPVQLYGEAHLPYFTDGGIDVKAGRFFGISGYESSMAPSRPLNSGSYMFGYSHPFTHIGLLSTAHVTDQLNVYKGVINGWDRWLNAHDKWGLIVGASWDSKDGKTNLTSTLTYGPDQFYRYTAANNQVPPANMPNPPFLASRRNLSYRSSVTALFSTVLIHEWDDDLTLVGEADQGFETNVPGLDSTGVVRNAAWYGLGGWALYRLTDNLTGVYRAEWFDDRHGSRTGFDDTFYEMTLGLIYKPRTWFWIRPEVRFDWATGQAPFDDNRKHEQLTLGFDSIFLF